MAFNHLCEINIFNLHEFNHTVATIIIIIIIVIYTILYIYTSASRERYVCHKFSLLYNILTGHYKKNYK